MFFAVKDYVGLVEKVSCLSIFDGFIRHNYVSSHANTAQPKQPERTFRILPTIINIYGCVRAALFLTLRYGMNGNASYACDYSKQQIDGA